MKILYLNRQLAFREETFTFREETEIAERYRAFLEGRGHQVRIYSQLNELCSEDSLESFDLALVHPTDIDTAAIRKEVDRRRDFRVILHTSHPKNYDHFLYLESDRVMAYSRIPVSDWAQRKDELARFVEKGWSE